MQVHVSSVLPSIYLLLKMNDVCMCSGARVYRFVYVEVTLVLWSKLKLEDCIYIRCASYKFVDVLPSKPFKRDLPGLSKRLFVNIICEVLKFLQLFNLS